MSGLEIAVTGGGRIGHFYAAYLSSLPGVRVRFQSRKAEAMAAAMPAEGITAVFPDGATVVGRPALVSSDVGEVVAGADLVLVAQTANGRPDVLAAAAPHLATDKPVAIGGMPGCACFDWLAERALGLRDNLAIFGFLDVPHVAARAEPGVRVELGGVKAKAHVGFHEATSAVLKAQTVALLRRLLPMPVEPLGHYLEVTLTPLGYMHPTVLYALFGPYSQWDGRPVRESRRWFTDLTELGGYFIKRCDEEQVRLTRAVEEALGVSLPMAEPLYDNLVSAYGDQIEDHSTLYTVLRTCKAYRSYIPMVEAPEGGLVFKKDHPILIEDVFYGMAFLVEMGRRLGVPMPTMAEIHDWSVGFLGGPRPSAVDYMPADWPARALARPRQAGAA
jgi:hypothetical protein